MGATWDCERHDTTQLGYCYFCEYESRVHSSCNDEIAQLKERMAKLEKALKSVELHMRIVSPTGYKHSTIYAIVSKALAALEETK